MTIGSSINYSVPTTGTTVGTMQKVLEGIFSDGITIGSTDYPAMLSLRPAQVISKRKRFGATYRVSPSTLDDPGSLTKGSLSVSVNIDATVGSVLTEAEIVTQVKYALSTLLAANIISDLSLGGLE